MEKPDLSIVIPTHNSEGFIEKNVEKVILAAKKLGMPFEIIIAEDGCSDRTPEIAGKLSKKYSFVTHQHYVEKLGRGLALKRAFAKSRGKVTLYMDDDLATDLKHLPQLVGYVLDGGYDVVTGSRLMKGSKVNGRPAKREVASRVFNFLVRLLLRSRVRDHQCGFKAFKRASILALLPEIKDNYWFFDTEILVVSERKGLKIMEFPISWADERQNSTVRLYRDAIYMGKSILRNIIP